MVESPFLPPQAVMSCDSGLLRLGPVVWSLAPALVPWKEHRTVIRSARPGMEKAT